jgi:ATP-dependent helicase/nuclease subunit A
MVNQDINTNPVRTAQEEAILAQGRVLVAAGAGTGKTHTLIERCLEAITRQENPSSIERMLVVTFTDAAAAELRKRLRDGLEKRVLERPDDSRLAGQLACLDAAFISTLDSFCLRLVRENFFLLGLDPKSAVLPEGQAVILFNDTLDDVIAGQYAGSAPLATAVREFIANEYGGDDEPLRALVRRLHRYGQSLPDPARWLEAQRALCARECPHQWVAWLERDFPKWAGSWLGILEEQEHPVAQTASVLLQRAIEQPVRAVIAASLQEICNLAAATPTRGKQAAPKPVKALFEEVQFLFSAIGAPDASGANDSLARDWQWARASMRTVLELTQLFGECFAAAKRQQAALDFADIEQFALRILCESDSDRPSAAALEWRQRLDLVFVDEYQDINAAQDAIIRMLSREGAQGNLFLVGDVKQSIYRFRRAAPHIFQNYYRQWQAGSPHERVIPLTDNFRSHESILECVNAVFGDLMRAGMGGVNFDRDAALHFGNRAGRSHFAAAATSDPSPPRVELCLRWTSKADHAANSEDDPLAELKDLEKEARFVALRLRRLHDEKFQVWHRETRCFKNMEWRNAVVLLRSIRSQTDTYARAFASLGIPLECQREGFYDSPEVADLLHTLEILDNPLQDLPLLAVLRSPLAGFTLDELAEVRVALGHGLVWTALQKFHHDGPVSGDASSAFRQSAWTKANRFLKAHARWRKLARQEALSRCLETILDDTDYEAWLKGRPRGNQRLGNVQRLLDLTREFDQFQRQGLFRFLSHVEAQQEAGQDANSAGAPLENAVRLISVHRSKGLEFPIVVMAALGQRFNKRDTSERIILDEEYGLCPRIKPPGSNLYYSSVMHWLATRRQNLETLGEEMRLLYVAMTRACDHLILVGTAPESRREENAWPAQCNGAALERQLAAAGSYLDWIGPWMCRRGFSLDQDSANPLLAWRQWSDTDLAAGLPEDVVSLNEQAQPPRDWRAIDERIFKPYPHAATTREPAKASVSALRKRLIDDGADEAQSFLGAKSTAFLPPPSAGTNISELTGAEKGTAHHAFLENMVLEKTTSLDELHAQADQLQQAGVFSATERQALNLESLWGFWKSDIGALIRANAASVHRELPFTARFSLTELAETGLPFPADAVSDPAIASEFVVVQGVIDLAIIRPDEIWLLDYKTDRVSADGVDAKMDAYLPQLRLYSQALTRIYKLPVKRAWLYFLTPGIARPVELS